MDKKNIWAATSFAIDSNSNSCLLFEIDDSNETLLMVTEDEQRVPPVAATYSLFSENILLLNRD